VKKRLIGALRDVDAAEWALATAYHEIAERHADESDVRQTCLALAEQCDSHLRQLTELASRSSVDLESADRGSFICADADGTLLRDLRRLFLLACDCDIAWTMLGQGAKAGREPEVVELFTTCSEEITGHVRWAKSKCKLAAPQVLAVG
jgi:rubrerythrin